MEQQACYNSTVIYKKVKGCILLIDGLDYYKQKWQVEASDIIKPGLEAINLALEKLNNPHKNLPFVHIAGTNGKGSTLTFLDEIAIEHGLKVGKFMSPCILDVHDQIQVNKMPIDEKAMDKVFLQMKNARISGLLTDFELLTCAAFLHFQNEKVDIVLLETGLGGLEDSTNVVDPIVSIITSIALEHTRILGKTIESITQHKAGIIKNRKPVVIGKLPNEAYLVIEQKAHLKQSMIHAFNQQFYIEQTGDEEAYINEHRGIKIDGLKRKMVGNHQGVNMALAITAFFEVANYFHIEVNINHIRNAVKRASLPSRFEQVLPNVYFDGAHNPASVEKLIETIQKYFPNQNIRFVVGMLADKDVKSCLHLLERISNEFYFVDFNNPRAADAKELLEISNASNKSIVKDYVSFIKKCATLHDITIVTGSLYLLAEIRSQL